MGISVALCEIVQIETEFSSTLSDETFAFSILIRFKLCVVNRNLHFAGQASTL